MGRDEFVTEFLERRTARLLPRGRSRGRGRSGRPDRRTAARSAQIPGERGREPVSPATAATSSACELRPTSTFSRKAGATTSASGWTLALHEVSRIKREDSAVNRDGSPGQ